MAWQHRMDQPVLHSLQTNLANAALHDAPGAVLDQVQTMRGDRARRLGVYRTNVINSLTEVLGAAFPVVHRIVGERFFRAVAKAFVEAHPPEEPVLYRYGAAFPAFLRAHESAEDLPYLAAVAELEWARVISYFAADADPLDPQRLATVDPDALERVTFAVHPAFQVIRAAHPVFEIWQVNQPHITDVPRVDLTRPETGVVFRRGHEVAQRPVSEATAAWLSSLAAGRSLGVATEQAAADPKFDLQDALRQALADGVFTDISV